VLRIRKNLVGKETSMTASIHLVRNGSASEFVNALIQEVNAHPALNHEYLKRLSLGDMPNVDAALRDYAFNYSFYSNRFVSYLDAVIDGMKDEGHKELIRENLLEEEGDPMAVELKDKPHVEIFADFKARIGVNDQYLASNEVCDTVQFWSETFLSCCENERNGCGLGAIGIATEFIVPEIYQHFINAIEQHSTFDNNASLFFRLHVDCDDGHGDDLVNVIKDVAAEPSEREAIRFGALLALNLRSAFWDAMLARALAMETQQQLAPAA
tara:strand:+ start:2200 stop:3006 length:807 start_codon:yes stop_codon:yes gene_type:complete